MRQLKNLNFLIATFIIHNTACCVSIWAEKFSYTGYKLLRLYPTTAEQFELIHSLESQDPNFDVWNTIPKKSADVMLSSKVLSSYYEIFASKKIRFEVVHENVQELIDRQEMSIKKWKNTKGSKNSILYTFPRYSEIINFIETTANDNSDILYYYNAGFTAQNRRLDVLVFNYSATTTRSIWIDCGIHAREWVAPAVCVYFIDTLLHDIRRFDPETMNLVSKYQIHVLPLVNPDGYEYTHTTNRLWRKNRTNNPGSTCVGTDLNRNYIFQWMQNGGASNNPCSETFAGVAPESELETKSVVGAVSKKLGNWDAFLTIHSYGQLWLTPFGYTLTPPVDEAEVKAAAKVGADAIKDYNGTVYTVGSSAEILYIGSGSSRDWAYGAANIKYSNTIELPPGEGTPDYSYGFTLPADRLPKLVKETYAGIRAFLKHVSDVSMN